MKLRLLALCLLLCALLSVTALAADSEDLLNDHADILTEQEEATVLARLQEVSQGVDVAVADLKMATRHYAKRQLTWFNKKTNYHKIYVDKENPLEKSIEILGDFNG